MRAALLALLLAGCGPARAPQAGMARLTLPLAAGSEGEIARLPPLQRAYALVDLFDLARLLGDGEARAVLWRALALPGKPARGEAATLKVIEALTTAAARAHAPQLAALLEADLEELSGGDALSLAQRRRAVAAADDPASAHALLSLYASCARALVDAANGPAWRRAAIADRCLYPLFTADPEPYFRADPSARPPDPPWATLLAGLRQLLAQTRARAPRLAAVLVGLASELDRFAEAVERDGVAPPDVTLLAATLPAGDDELPPYDRQPWVIVEGDMAVVGRARFTTRDHALVERIERVLAAERITGVPGRVALFVPGTGSADVIDSLGELARRGGAESLDLALAAPVSVRAPAGDVWAARPPAHRFVVLPLGLRASSGRDGPREVGQHAASITLLVAPEGLSALATDGAVLLGPVAEASPRLRELRLAFPDEPEIALAIDPTASVRDVVAAARAARVTFRRVALIPMPHRPVRDQLAARVRRRAAAKLTPRDGGTTLGARAEILRGCYLDALDRDPRVAGSITFLPGRPPTLGPGGPADPELRDCLAKRAAALALSSPLTVELAPR